MEAKTQCDVQKLYPIFYMSPPSCKKKKDICQVDRRKFKSLSIESRKRKRIPTECEEVFGTPKRPTPKRKIKLLNGGSSKEQLYLDLGQNLFGHVQCDGCGMVYSNGQLDDSVDHYRFHHTVEKGVSFKGWKEERVVERHVDGRILVVIPTDSKQHLKKVEDVLKVVDSELGYSGLHSQVKSNSKSFLFISNCKEVIGYVMAESISQAYRMVLTDEEKENDFHSSLSANWCCSESCESAVVGISRIWVLSRFRRKGIATRLIDAVRKNFTFGYTVPKRLLAFSDPTPDGRAFAMQYCGGNSVLIYRWVA